MKNDMSNNCNRRNFVSSTPMQTSTTNVPPVPSVKTIPKRGYRPEDFGTPFPNFVLREHEVPSICRCIFDGNGFYVLNSNDMHILNHNGSFGVSSLTHRGPSYEDKSYLSKPYYARKIARESATVTDIRTGAKKTKIELLDPAQLSLAKNLKFCERHGPQCQSCLLFKSTTSSFFKGNDRSSEVEMMSDCDEDEVERTLEADVTFEAELLRPNNSFLMDNINLKCNIDEERLILMPEEAIFLSFGVGCLTIHTPRGEIVGYKKAWKRLVETNPEFPIAYAVYHYFRSKNWVPKLGDTYGASYLLYNVGPSAFHASYLVHILGFPSQPTPTWNELHSWIRLGNHVSKNVLMCEVSLPRRFDAFSSEPRSIFEMSLKETSLFRWKSKSGTVVKF